jgi:MFS family permease
VTTPERAAHGIDGRRAWVIAIASAVAVGLGFGTAYSFGTFFGEMADDLGAGRGGTATVFGITIFLFFGFGVVSGRLSDRYGPRRLLVAAALLMSTGLLLTSRVHSLWAGFLTYGIGVGIGAGLYITPLFAVVGGWFDRSRAVGLGVVSAGSGLGTLLVNPTANRLIEAHGWRTTYVVLALVDLVVLLVVSTIVERPPIPPPPPGGGHLQAVSHTVPFRLLFASALLMSVALFVAFAFVVPFAEDEGVSAGAASLLVGIIGAASVAGRLVLSVLTKRVGPLRLYKGCLVVQPIAYVVWLGAGGRYAMLVVFAVILGASYGGYVALGPTVAAALFGVVGLGGLLGLLYLGAGIGGLVGPPLAGGLADATSGQLLPIGVALLFTIAGAVVTLAIPEGAPVPGDDVDVALTQT